MKRYTSESCHSIGYSWEIDAPESLSAEDVEALQQALIDYTDTPQQSDLEALLSMIPEYLANYIEDAESKAEDIAQVAFSVERVHGEAFTQSFSEA